MTTYDDDDDVSFVPVMYNNDSMSEKAKILVQKVKRKFRRQPYQEVTEITPLFIPVKVPKYAEKTTTLEELSEPFVKINDMANEDCATNPWIISASSNLLLFILRWPITFVLWCTIPDSRRFKQFYILTFINCVFWIGCISFFVVFLTTDVGK